MLDISERYKNTANALQAVFAENAARLAELAQVEAVKLVSTADGCFHVHSIADDCVAWFAIQYMPNCGPIAVLCDAAVNHPYQNRGIGTLLHAMRLDAARRAGARVAVATVVQDNAPQIRIMERFNYRVAVPPFLNPVTGRWIAMYSLEL